MVNNNNTIPIEVNKKPFETVQELEKYEIKKSPLSPAARAKVMNKSGSNYVSEDRESYGPMYGNTSNSSNTFSIDYSFKHGVNNDKFFFERSGIYSNELKISGSLWKLRDELQKLENGEIRLFELVRGNYKRDRYFEEKVKDDLEDDIRKFEEMVRNGRVEYNGSGREYGSSSIGIY